jgi:hypothetical protein
VVVCVSWFTILASIAASALVIAWGLASRADRRKKWLLVASLLLAFFAFTITVLSEGLVFIGLDERGVVISALDEGVRPEPLQPGLNWVIPYLENVVTYQVGEEFFGMNVFPKVGSQVNDDMVQVETVEGDKRYVGAYVEYSIDPDRVVEVHIRWQDQYEENFVRPVVRGVIRDVYREYDPAEIASDIGMTFEEKINVEGAAFLQEGGILLQEIMITADLTEQGYFELLEQRRSEEPEQEDISGDQERSLARFQSVLQTVACLAFPVMVIVAVVLSLQRKTAVSEPPVVAAKGEASDAAQVVGMDTFQASSPEEYYLLGKALLEKGERSQAIEAFTEAYRTSEDPILKKKALEQLEGLDAVKKL